LLTRCSIYTEFEFEELEECFSDGATFEINPVGIALRENRALKRRAGDHEAGEHDPAYVVSLGTGSSKHIPHHADGFWGMLLRMWGFFNSRFEGERSWRDFVLDHPRLQARGKLFRFDVAFDGKAPSLDNIDRIPEMKDLAFDQYASSATIDELELTVGVDMFYFELRCPTRDDMDEIVVAGRVLCRWKKSPKRSFQAWLRYVQDSKVRVIVEGQSRGYLEFDQHGNLVRDVDLRIKSPQNRVSVQIQSGSEKPQHIGGSPFCVASLAEMQGLDTALGVPERAKRKRVAECSTPPNKRARLF
jgi:hypothetical protein